MRTLAVIALLLPASTVLAPRANAQTDYENPDIHFKAELTDARAITTLVRVQVVKLDVSPVTDKHARFHLDPHDVQKPEIYRAWVVAAANKVHFDDLDVISAWGIPLEVLQVEQDGDKANTVYVRTSMTYMAADRTTNRISKDDAVFVGVRVATPRDVSGKPYSIVRSNAVHYQRGGFASDDFTFKPSYSTKQTISVSVDPETGKHTQHTANVWRLDLGLSEKSIPGQPIRGVNAYLGFSSTLSERDTDPASSLIWSAGLERRLAMLPHSWATATDAMAEPVTVGYSDQGLRGFLEGAVVTNQRFDLTTTRLSPGLKLGLARHWPKPKKNQFAFVPKALNLVLGPQVGIVWSNAPGSPRSDVPRLFGQADWSGDATVPFIVNPHAIKLTFFASGKYWAFLEDRNVHYRTRGFPNNWNAGFFEAGVKFPVAGSKQLLSISYHSGLSESTFFRKLDQGFAVKLTM